MSTVFELLLAVFAAVGYPCFVAGMLFGELRDREDFNP